MLDTALLNQIRQVLAPLTTPVTLVAHASDHPDQDDLLALLDQIASCSPAVSVGHDPVVTAAPTFRLDTEDGATGMAFAGLPLGHELSSLILSVLYAGGLGKRPDDDTLDRIRRLQGPIRLETVISLSCENCPDVVQMLHLMATVHDDFTHTMVDGALIQDRIASLGIRGVPSVLAGDVLVSSGKASLGDLLDRLEAHFGTASREAVHRGHRDVVIIGGGPAGASAAIYAARKGLSTTVVTDRMGGQLMDTVGIENLASIPYTEGPSLTSKLEEHLGRYAVERLTNRRVATVTPGKPHRLTFEDGDQLDADALIVATGARWRELGVPGERDFLGKGVAFCPHCDGPLFKGRDIAVVGGGNSGVEAALDLAGIVRSVTVLELGETARADAVLLDRLAALPNASLITGAETLSIDGDETDGVRGLTYRDRATGTTHTLDVAGVFVQIGLVPNSRFLDGVVEMNRFGEIAIDERTRTTRPGIYAAGDVTTTPFKQIVVAMGEGAKAALTAYEDRLMA
jgi:alkyl hydroperoxide reductase subunit F